MDERRFAIESFLSRKVVRRSRLSKDKVEPACGDWRVRTVVLSADETLVTMEHPLCVVTVALGLAPQVSDPQFGAFLDSVEDATSQATSDAVWPSSEFQATPKARSRGQGRVYRG